MLFNIYIHIYIIIIYIIIIIITYDYICYSTTNSKYMRKWKMLKLSTVAIPVRYLHSLLRSARLSLLWRRLSF